ncbi:unnamed protein product [Cylindrotheca closterium]|uniref:DUF4203 domain-containing protein n=1 Tax=Cylindrotheca closterium TaxID=2856 RepID=A0AAD2G735_9STRA|nr:unnamed protein product [Cylindrotheca closterium]
MRNNSNTLCCLLFLLLLQLAVRSGAHEVQQSLLTNEKELAGDVELAATHFRRRLEEEGGATNEGEGGSNGDGGAAKADESENKDSEDEDSSSSDEDEPAAAKDEDDKEGSEKAEESAAKDEDGKDEESSSSDEAADGDAKEDEPAAAPELDDASKQYFETTKDTVLKDEKKSSSDEDEEVGSYSVLDPPPSFYDLKEYSIETITMTSCQKIDFAFAYLTSLEFDGSVLKNAKTKQDDSNFWSDIYIIEMIVLPTSLILAFFGSSLLMLASMLTAAGFGTFLIFHFVSGAFGGLDCKVKLGLSVVSATISAFLAMKFVRFGLFTLGAFSSGLSVYLFFDAFPAFDPGQNFFDVQGFVSDASYISSVVKNSDISQAAWAIIVVLALFTGICIRVYEHSSVELLTALLGGSGAGYAIHAHILVHGGSLPRSLVFVVAGLIGIFGWRFQRRQRVVSPQPTAKGKSLPQYNTNTPSNGATWNSLQKSIDNTIDPQAQGKDN